MALHPPWQEGRVALSALGLPWVPHWRLVHPPGSCLPSTTGVDRTVCAPAPSAVATLRWRPPSPTLSCTTGYAEACDGKEGEGGGVASPRRPACPFVCCTPCVL
jgi:hypothetical protein